jgi:hypothetical protein
VFLGSLSLPTARLLLRLAERELSGRFTFRAGPRRYALDLRNGRLEGVEGVGMPVLGDVLLGLYPDRNGLREALLAAPCTRLLGSHLVVNGVLTASALCTALRELHVQRLRAFLAQEDARLDAHESALPNVTGLHASVPLGGALLAGLLPRRDEARLLADELQAERRLNARGRRYVAELSDLRRHPSAQLPARAQSPGHTEQPVLQVLSALGLLRAEARSGRYAVLLKARRAVNRRLEPAQLLGLEAGANAGDARVRLRAMARVLHPDLFHGSAPSLVREAERVLAALTSAASAVACGSMRTA